MAINKAKLMNVPVKLMNAPVKTNMTSGIDKAYRETKTPRPTLVHHALRQADTALRQADTGFKSPLATRIQSHLAAIAQENKTAEKKISKQAGIMASKKEMTRKNKPMTAVSEKAMRVADKAFGRAEVRNMIQQELGSMGKARNTLESAMKSGVTNKKKFAGVRKQYKSGKLSKMYQ